jgi:hypothetical protein
MTDEPLFDDPPFCPKDPPCGNDPGLCFELDCLHWQPPTFKVHSRAVIAEQILHGSVELAKRMIRENKEADKPHPRHLTRGLPKGAI